ncbi:hypothetical protein OF83DRAFT_1149095 [Amylostereum chailletii]|nr:hypothetical protein OF83DRAFT_1149095 [Amylostereum chailletii]
MSHQLLRVLPEGIAGPSIPDSDCLGLQEYIDNIYNGSFPAPAPKRRRVSAPEAPITPDKGSYFRRASSSPSTPSRSHSRSHSLVGGHVSTRLPAKTSGPLLAPVLEESISLPSTSTNTNNGIEVSPFSAQEKCPRFPTGYSFHDVYHGIIRVCSIARARKPRISVLSAMRIVWPERDWPGSNSKSSKQPTSFDNARKALRQGNRVIWDEYLSKEPSAPDAKFSHYKNRVNDLVENTNLPEFQVNQTGGGTSTPTAPLINDEDTGATSNMEGDESATAIDDTTTSKTAIDQSNSNQANDPFKFMPANFSANTTEPGPFAKHDFGTFTFPDQFAYPPLDQTPPVTIPLPFDTPQWPVYDPQPQYFPDPQYVPDPTPPPFSPRAMQDLATFVADFPPVGGYTIHDSE